MDWTVLAMGIAPVWMLAGWVALSNPRPHRRSRAGAFAILGIMPLIAMVWAAGKACKWLFEPRY